MYSPINAMGKVKSKQKSKSNYAKYKNISISKYIKSKGNMYGGLLLLELYSITLITEYNFH